MKKIIYALILLASWPSFARQFDIEVILFKRDVEPSSYQESWPDVLDPINLERAFSYRDKAMMNKNGAFLISQYKLNDVYQKLQNHAGFKPLMHVAWRQDDSGASRSPIFHIQAGQDFSDRFVADGRTIADANADLSLVPLDAPTPTPALVEGDENLTPETPAIQSGPILELDGTMQVYVQHYLYVVTELDLKVPGKHEFIVNTPTEKEVTVEDSIEGDVVGISNEENIDVANAELEPTQPLNDNIQLGHLEDVTPETEIKEFLKSYRMKEKRQMRSGETHYIDHPLMGMIIQVRKV